MEGYYEHTCCHWRAAPLKAYRCPELPSPTSLPHFQQQYYSAATDVLPTTSCRTDRKVDFFASSSSFRPSSQRGVSLALNFPQTTTMTTTSTLLLMMMMIDVHCHRLFFFFPSSTWGLKIFPVILFRAKFEHLFSLLLSLNSVPAKYDLFN